MSAIQALPLPEEAKKNIGDLEFFWNKKNWKSFSVLSGIQDLLYVRLLMAWFELV
ncbi:10380_t:CDS:2 [Entrophospora sp. SA101]|nr:10380_t:CDS:2 [Entrophospora sp. SA101]CAJ0839586.1 22216_t:CDS:2 [Entrophospora sp. SA101]